MKMNMDNIINFGIKDYGIYFTISIMFVTIMWEVNQ